MNKLNQVKRYKKLQEENSALELKVNALEHKVMLLDGANQHAYIAVLEQEIESLKDQIESLKDQPVKDKVSKYVLRVWS